MKQEWSREGDDPRCGNCRHWALTDQELLGASDDPAGQCRRRAPVRSVSEVELAGRIASAVHDVGLRIMDAAGKVMTVAGYDAKDKRTVRDPIPEHERHYAPHDDDNYDGYGDLVGLQQSWPLTFDWAWCGEHEPLRD